MRSNVYKDDGPTFSHHSYVPDKLISLLNKSINKSIIDFGCGNGFITRQILRKGFSVFGVDESISGIDIANKEFPGRFFVQDLSQSPIPRDLSNIKFDTIIASEVIEHLYAPNQFISFCKSILVANGGGELIISVPYHSYSKNLALSIFNKWDFHHTVLWDGGHIKFFSKKTLSEMLTNHGFEITSFIGCGRIPYLWKSMIIKAKI